MADEFEDPTNTTIDVLIGSDYYWEFVTGNVIKRISDPVAMESKLGWILSGVVDISESSHNNKISSMNLILHESDVGFTQSHDDLVCSLEKFWQTESIDICGSGKEFKAEVERFLSNVHYNRKRYNVKLPLKEGAETLPDHYQLSMNEANYLLQGLIGKV